MVKLFLPKSGSIIGIPVTLEVVDVEIPPLLGLDVLYENNLLVDNITNHILSRIVTNKDPVGFEVIWKIRLIKKGDHLYARLFTPIQLFYTILQLRKLHKQFVHPSATKLYNLLKAAGTKALILKTIEKLKHLLSTCEPYQRIRNAPKR